jgi:hypothetical protein
MRAVYSLFLIFISTSATRCEPRRFDPYTAHHFSNLGGFPRSIRKLRSQLLAIPFSSSHHLSRLYFTILGALPAALECDGVLFD